MAIRIDQMLVERGIATSRAQAQRLISAGVRWRGEGAEWKTAAKNGDLLPPAAQIELLDAAEARYVSRGGLKLEAALRAAGVDPTGRVCLDIGQSTGGFTDCLLRHGAQAVVGVDVGRGQLHAALRTDPRVACIEGLNARSLDAAGLQQALSAADAIDLIAACVRPTCADGTFDVEFPFITGDVSFISLTLVLPALAPLLAPGADLLMLVKPQFELQPGQVGKGGIVRDTALYAVVEARLREACAACGLRVLRWFDSPIAGGDGNREFFIHARRAA